MLNKLRDTVRIITYGFALTKVFALDSQKKISRCFESLTKIY